MPKMETIQIEIPSELAQRLRPYRSDLPRILEWGLRHIKKEAETESEARKRLIAALRQAGATVHTSEEIAQYLAERENQGWTSVQAGGKPASKMIVEERGSHSWLEGTV